MLFESLWLLLTLGKEKAQQAAAARQVQEWKNDIDLQRKEFFVYKKKWGEDIFTLFGQIGSTGGRDHRWNEAKEKLDLLEEGYFPYPMGIRLPITDESLCKYKLEKSQYKIVPNDRNNYAELYMALSSVEDYIDYRNRTGNYYKLSICEEIPKEIRKLFYDGKTTIGVPYGHGLGQPVPCQAMTFREAREFMQDRMEERFQKYWENMKK